MTGPTRNLVQKNMLNTASLRGQVSDISRQFKPEFQQSGTRIGMQWTALKDKFGKGEVTPEDKQSLSDFTQYRASAAQMFSNVLKEMSGVAVNPTEFKRAETYLPNPGTGVFDGDSPTELEAKTTRLKEFTDKAIAKYHYINTRGFTVDDVDIDQMPSIMNRRGAELEQEIKAQMPNAAAEEVKGMVKEQLASEFELVYGR
jgi:hypothetical protein